MEYAALLLGFYYKNGTYNCYRPELHVCIFERIRFFNISCNLESGINVASGKFGKKNKCSPIFTLYSYYYNSLYGVRNKAVAPGKKPKN